MKKIAVIFIIIMLLGLSACSNNTDTAPKNELHEINQNVSKSGTVEIVTEKEKYSQNDTIIKYTITNNSDEESAIAGDDHCFTLQFLKDGEWMRVGTKIEHCWNELALILPTEQSVNREIELETYFNLPLEKGEYRIAVEGLISNTFEIS